MVEALISSNVWFASYSLILSHERKLKNKEKVHVYFKITILCFCYVSVLHLCNMSVNLHAYIHMFSTSAGLDQASSIIDIWNWNICQWNYSMYHILCKSSFCVSETDLDIFVYLLQCCKRLSHFSLRIRS